MPHMQRWGCCMWGRVASPCRAPPTDRLTSAYPARLSNIDHEFKKTAGVKPAGPSVSGPSGGLERCTVAALAEAHKVINRPKAKVDRKRHTPGPAKPAGWYPIRPNQAMCIALD